MFLRHRRPSGFVVSQLMRNARDRCRELDRLNGLREMRLESCQQDSSPIFRARVARQRDRGEKPSMFSFMLPNLPDQRVPVLVRQADIAHEGVEPADEKSRHRLVVRPAQPGVAKLVHSNKKSRVNLSPARTEQS